MEGKYRQKSMYLDFFLILLTSLFLKTFKHVWHIIVFISMLWSLFFMLSLILYWNTNVSLFFPAWILTSFFHILYYVTYIDYANHKSLSMKTNTIYVKMFRFKRHYTSKHFALRCFCGDQKKNFGGGGVGWAKFCAVLSFCFLLQPLRSVFAIFSWLNPLYLCHKLGLTC